MRKIQFLHLVTTLFHQYRRGTSVRRINLSIASVFLFVLISSVTLGAQKDTNQSSIFGTSFGISSIETIHETKSEAFDGKLIITLAGSYSKKTKYDVLYDYHIEGNPQAFKNLSASEGKLIIEDVLPGSYYNIRVKRNADNVLASAENNLVKIKHGKVTSQTSLVATCGNLSWTDCDGTARSQSGLQTGRAYNSNASYRGCGFEVSNNCQIVSTERWHCVEGNDAIPNAYTEFTTGNYYNAGFTALQTARLNWITCNYAYNADGVAAALWHLTGTGGSANSIYQAAVSAIPTADGSQNNVVFYIPNNSSVQTMMQYDCKVVCSGTITDIKIYNQDTDAAVVTITNGAQIQANTLPNNYYIATEVNGNLSSVLMTVNGVQEGCESVAPYTFPKGAENNVNWNGGIGTHTVVAHAYSSTGCGGPSCDSKTITFEIVDVAQGTVSGHLYIDTNGNGVQDAGEPNLANVDVKITDNNGVTQTVSTDGNGDYTATVVAGITKVDVDENDPQYPSGYTQTEGSDPKFVNVLNGQDTDAGDNGYYLPGTVNGHLYIDENGNGVQDAGEADLVGVDVKITDSNGVTQTVTTDANGDYIASVPPGATIIDVDENDPQYPSGSTQTEGNDPTVVTAVTGINVDAGDNGYYQPASVSGHLYIDENGNGVQDAGEADLAGVDVKITDDNGVTQTVTTDANGDYTASVPPGATIIDVDENDPQYPSGFIQTEGNDPTIVTAVTGQDTDAGNDGFYQPASVSGHLYIDENGNGVQDAGEADLAGVDVKITDDNGVTQTVTTDANGDYTASVPPGATIIDVDENDPQYPSGFTQTEGNDPTIVTAVGGQDTDAGNDGYYQPASVSGHLYIDENGNGVQDAGEADLAGVDVKITDANGVSQTVTTDADGNWEATVVPGLTVADVDENDADYPSGFTQTEGNDPTSVTAVGGQDTDAGNDGYYQPATVSGHLYLDTNGNGTQEAGEPNLADVDVKVTDSNGAVQIVSTDVNGDWEASVPPGETSADVDENDADYPAGYTQTEGDDPSSVIAVGGTDTDAGNDGYYLAGTVSGHLYLDGNNNGVQDAGEADLAGVDVKITDSNGDTQTVTTDANGDWVATVPPGGTIAEVDENDTDYPAGSTQTEGDNPTSVTAIAGEDKDAGNDGYYIPAEVFGHLYIDENANGVQDPGEEDLAGIDVVITDSNGVAQTVVSDSNGDWVAVVPAGNTTADVQVNDPDFPEGYAQAEGTNPTVSVAISGESVDGGTDGYSPCPGIPVVNVDNTVLICEGEPVTFDVLNVIADASYVWDFGFGASPSTATGSGPHEVFYLEPSASGTYVTISVMKEQCPPKFATVATIKTSAIPTAEIIADASEICVSENKVFEAGSKQSGAIYTWDFGTDASPSTAVGAGPHSVMYTSAGAKTATLEVDPNYSDLKNCPSTTEMSFQVEDCNGSVFGHLYLDENGNGVQDGTEPDLANVDVILIDQYNNMKIVSTDANGDWSSEIAEGPVTANVNENDPDYPTGSTQTEGDDPTSVVVVRNEAKDAGNDGYYVPAAVFGHLYLDQNENFIQDGTEPDLAGVDVIVTDANGAVQTVTSDANGDWNAVVPAGGLIADVDETDADYPTGSTQTEGTDPTPVSVLSGENKDAGNDGFFIPAEVIGHLYLDENNNGTQDVGEPDLAGVDVIITDSKGNVTTVTTNADGDWIAEVPAGVTSAKVDDTDPDYPTGSVQTEGDDPSVVTGISESTVDAGNDGYYVPSTVFGHVYYDDNNNGVQDAGEANIAGLSVIVTDSNGDVQTVETDANGDWTAEVPAGVASAKLDNTDADYPTGATQTEGDDPSNVLAVSGSAKDAGNDGFFKPATIFGHLYYDDNNNGVQDGSEADLSDIDVVITDANGTVMTVTTDANGDWSAQVLEGSATVKVDVTDADFPLGAVQTEGDDPSTVLAERGENKDAGNDGYYVPTEVFGHLYLDENNNNVQEAGEPDLANVDVKITKSDGSTLTVSTDANGDWKAPVTSGLTIAQVDETDPDYPTGSTQTEGNNPTIVSAILRQSTDAGNDGYYVPAEVFGHLYIDENNNGTQDAGEPNLANIDVLVTDASGVIQTVTTDGNGDWVAEVIAGSTTAKVDRTDPDFPMNATQTEGDDPTVVTAISGESVDNGIDGYTLGVTDITPVVTFLPGVANGSTPMAWQIKCQELLGVPTNGTITMVMPKDPRLSFSYEANKTSVGPFVLENAKWAYNAANASFHIWTTTDVIPASGSSTFGFEALYTPENSTGEVTYTVTIITGSGGENNFLNNIDAETLVYFNN